ncbi:hypothetical protein ACQFX9_28150 [Aliinostoc sp. HNIBRCY26]|uniref:hypothetical protein n=1 Tax=Aliinostoc sp. HNIBRCY26 TaxID=3418997 RepID=UPI003D05E6BA
MKTFKLLKVLTATLVMSVSLTQAIAAQTPTIQVSRNLPSDPLVVNGTSNTTVTSNCGNISSTPNHVIRVTEALPYLRVTAKGTGKPTLLIDGPGGRFCVIAESSTNNEAELSGYWPTGNYSVSVGNISQREYNYTIEISQQRPKK